MSPALRQKERVVLSQVGRSELLLAVMLRRHLGEFVHESPTTEHALLGLFPPEGTLVSAGRSDVFERLPQERPSVLTFETLTQHTS